MGRGYSSDYAKTLSLDWLTINQVKEKIKGVRAGAHGIEESAKGSEPSDELSLVSDMHYYTRYLMPYLPAFD